MESIIGKRFGKLVVVELLYRAKGHYYHRAICDCGNEHIAVRNSIIRGLTTQCKPCSNKQKSQSKMKNGSSKERYTYSSFLNMHNRCGNFENYKDVEICEEWKGSNGFVNFLRDMGRRPKGTSLDRIDNSKGYSKENCRWSSYSVQLHNKRKTTRKTTSDYIGVSKASKTDTYISSLQIAGKALSFHALKTEEEAAVLYDNLSEYIYGDRPNKTEYREIIPIFGKSGHVGYSKVQKKYKLALYDLTGKLVHMGYFEDEEEARAIKLESDRFRFYRHLELFKQSYDDSVVNPVA